MHDPLSWCYEVFLSSQDGGHWWMAVWHLRTPSSYSVSCLTSPQETWSQKLFLGIAEGDDQNILYLLPARKGQ